MKGFTRASGSLSGRAILVGLVTIFLIFAGPAGGSVTSVLAQQPSTSPAAPQQAPAPASPVPAPPFPQPGQKYLLGPGDTIQITVFGDDALSRSVTIRPDGKINLPLVGDIEAAGQTPVELGERIILHLRTYLRNPQVSVSVTNFHVERKFVYLVGHVTRPGPVEIQPGWSVFEVMAATGGAAPRAALKRASVIRRSTGQTLPLDLEKLLVRLDRSADVTVEPGDIIMVPAMVNRVYIFGSVGRPGLYDIDEGTRVMDMLALVGGPSDRPVVDNIGVIRLGPDNKPTISRVDMSRILRGDFSQNIALQHGDIIYVPQAAIVRWQDILTWLSGLSFLRGLFGF